MMAPAPRFVSPGKPVVMLGAYLLANGRMDEVETLFPKAAFLPVFEEKGGSGLYWECAVLAKTCCALFRGAPPSAALCSWCDRPPFARCARCKVRQNSRKFIASFSPEGRHPRRPDLILLIRCMPQKTRQDGEVHMSSGECCSA